MNVVTSIGSAIDYGSAGQLGEKSQREMDIKQILRETVGRC